MAESNPLPEATSTASAVAPAAAPEIKPPNPTKPIRPPNPIYKYMGLGENFQPKLPSRNWLIFLSITGSFTAAVIYDRREKKRAQRRWCKLVEHIAKEPLDPRSMPRKLTVFLEGPPTDGLRIAQDHFKEYVKPILVASGLDWEFIQGRKEGDVRAELAEKIRYLRTPPDQRTEEDAIARTRRTSNITEFDGPRGDIVIGRHTWKEYVRGLHEGWLGPLTEPPKIPKEIPLEEAKVEEKEAESPIETLPGITILSTPRDSDSPSPETASTETSPTPTDKLKKPPQPAPFISTSEYESAPTPPELPAEFDPSTPITFPHILGFLNTGTRLRRFLNKRALADTIGRETAAVVLSTYRPYRFTSETFSVYEEQANDAGNEQNGTDNQLAVLPGAAAEQQVALLEEERSWHKSTLVRVDDEPERTWLEPVVLDPRIAERMRRFELSAEDEARAAQIVVTEEEIEGWMKGSLRRLGRRGLKAAGFGKEKNATHGYGDEEVVE